jgi:RNA-binding protein
MLDNKQKSYLKKMAHDIHPVIQVGKGGIGDNLVTSVNEALEARELIKVSILSNTGLETSEIAEEIAFQTSAEVVAIIGRKLILYKESLNNRKIML